ncbi:MAG: helicase-associated domain-containing protein [Cuniculiplasma sp.]
MRPKTQVFSNENDPNYVRRSLADEDNLQNRLNSLSKGAQQFYASVYALGRSFIVDREMLKRKNKVLKPEVLECMDKLVIFGIPNSEEPEILIIPVDFAMAGTKMQESAYDVTMVNPLKKYPKAIIEKIAKYYRVDIAMPRPLVSAETYSRILVKLPETIANLNSNEKKIMDYLMADDGISDFNDLLDKFHLRKSYSHYYSISINELFSSRFYSNGESLISLMSKGLIYYFTQNNYYGTELVFIPDEIAKILWWEQTQKEKSVKLNMTKGTGSLQLVLKNYGFDFAAHFKEFFTVLYYLESRSKRRPLETIQKFLGMPAKDLKLIMEYARDEDWIKGGVTNVTIMKEALVFLEDKNFPTNLKRHVFGRHMFSAWEKEDTSFYLDNLRLLILQSLYNMEEPAKISDIIEEIKSSEKYFIFIRKTSVWLTKVDSSSHYSNSLSYIKKNMESKMSEWFFELYEFLRIYGLIKLSTPDLALETYIFPEPEFKTIYEKLGKFDSRIAVKDNPQPLKVLPNNEVLIGIDADFNDLKMLADFSELVSADLICTFTITKSSLSSYMNRSGELSKVLPFLEKKSSVPIPNTLERLIKDMEEKGKEITMTKCQAILQVKDKMIIDNIMGIKSISEMIEKRVSPEILVIKTGVSLYAFVSELRKKGYIIPIVVEKEKKVANSYGL